MTILFGTSIASVIILFILKVLGWGDEKQFSITG